MANLSTQAQQMAAADAAASVPTLQSINQQYGQSMHDVGGFTNALVAMLRGGAPVGGGYSAAQQAQQAINAAAASRLAALGLPNSGASAAAVQGMGDSSLGALLQRGAAASAYGAKMPAVAAARGALAQSSLVTAKNQAISQRNQQYGTNYLQALQAARAFGLSQAQMRQQNAQFNATQQYRYASLAQNSAQFNASQRQQYNEFLLGQQQQLRLAQAQGVGGFTPNEISSLSHRGQQDAESFITQGVPLQLAIQRLSQTMPLSVARQVALLAYSNITRPPKPDPRAFPTTRDANGQPTGAARAQYQKAIAGWRQAMSAYTTAYNSWRAYIASVARAKNPAMNGPANQRNPHPPGRG